MIIEQADATIVIAPGLARSRRCPRLPPSPQRGGRVRQLPADPITTSVIQSGLVSVSREMGVTLRRTAYSDIFNEGSDFSCGLFDAEGRLTAQGEFLPIHLGHCSLRSGRRSRSCDRSDLTPATP